MMTKNLESIDWGKMGGLVPAVIQDVATRDVLMLGYMSPESLEQTRATGRVTFFSRSKNRLWEKGESSGNTLECRSLVADCDNDTILVLAEPKGPTCHQGTRTCFGDSTAEGLRFLGELSEIIRRRYTERPEGSYTTKLFDRGIDRMAQKVGEEGVEVVIAAKNDDPQKLTEEAADLLFHLMVLLRARNLDLGAVAAVLKARNQ